MTQTKGFAQRRDDAGLASFPPLPPNASVGKRWKFRRNVVIYLAHRRNGISQRILADVFDLPRSRIASIVKEYSRFDHSRRGDRPDDVPRRTRLDPPESPGGGDRLPLSGPPLTW
jgi:hypothetical protein